MSHYTVAVFTSDKKQSIHELLAPYDENIEVEPYIEATKAQLIQEKKQQREDGTDEELYQKAIEGIEDRLDENGNLLSTYNPDSKWDWYKTGGRWKDLLILKKDQL